MKIDPSIAAVWQAAPESPLLAAWYGSHPSVRRLWGLEVARKMRVVISVEATNDNSDSLPIWLVNSTAWAEELSLATNRAVTLELFGSYPFDAIDLEPGEIVVADLHWRDSTVADA